MNLLLAILGFAGIAAVNVPALLRERRWRDFAVYAAFFVLAFVLAVLVALDIDIPSPIKAVQAFYRDILHLSFPQS